MHGLREQPADLNVLMEGKPALPVEDPVIGPVERVSATNALMLNGFTLWYNWCVVGFLKLSLQNFMESARAGCNSHMCKKVGAIWTYLIHMNKDFFIPTDILHIHTNIHWT